MTQMVAQEASITCVQEEDTKSELKERNGGGGKRVVHNWRDTEDKSGVSGLASCTDARSEVHHACVAPAGLHLHMLLKCRRHPHPANRHPLRLSTRHLTVHRCFLTTSNCTFCIQRWLLKFQLITGAHTHMAAQWECKIFDPGTLQLCPVTFFDCLLVSLEQTNIHTDRKTSKYKHANKNPESQISFISKGEGGRQREKKKRHTEHANL